MRTPLTPREQEVANWLFVGCTNKEIATELRISIRTVESHRNNIYDKWHIHSRRELIEIMNEVKNVGLYKSNVFVVSSELIDDTTTIMIGAR